MTHANDLIHASQETSLHASRLLSTVTGLSSDTTTNLLQQVGGIHQLAQLPDTALQQVPGIGDKTAAKIRALTEWTQLLHQTQMTHRSKVCSPKDVADSLMLEMSLLNKEELRVICLDTKNHIRNISRLYEGSVNTIVLRTAELFRDAITFCCPGIIIVHNHPSGDPTPSPDEIRLTQDLQALGKQLDIEVIDHLILAGNRFYSFKEHGQMA